MVESVDRGLYEAFEERARERILTRDPDDGPIVALALLLDRPIWTEDQDFFGSGIATWTTATVELYLARIMSLMPFARGFRMFGRAFSGVMRSSTLKLDNARKF
jgi:hypothetical protein